MLRKKPQIVTVPDPCQEDWNAMSETAKGKFCNSCQKEVIDFSDMADTEIFKILLTNKFNGCGRFDEEQLNRTILPVKSTHRFHYKKIAASILAVLSFRFTHAQSTIRSKTDTALSPVKKSSKQLATPLYNQYAVFGKVSSDSIGFSFTGTLEVLIGDRKTTITIDSLGYYTLTLNKEDIKEFTNISFIHTHFTTVVRSLHNSAFPVNVNVFFERQRVPPRRYAGGNVALIDSLPHKNCVPSKSKLHKAKK